LGDILLQDNAAHTIESPYNSDFGKSDFYPLCPLREALRGLWWWWKLLELIFW